MDGELSHDSSPKKWNLIKLQGNQKLIPAIEESRTVLITLMGLLDYRYPHNRVNEPPNDRD